MDNASFTSEILDDVAVVSVSGRLDPLTGPQFEEFVNNLIEQGNLKFVADLGGLEYISSAGLRSILSMAKKLRPMGGAIVFANLKGMAKDVFDISGFGSMFGIFETVSAAKDSLD
ncbi:MAG: STAS domain-containing protein [Desulfovibrio sp.]|uniref:STAS domain-containing protein n=1 Tax=Desulfovibrio sp. 7SRBS1 TaxID=3378064 RepID=UPI003B3D4445